MRARVTQGSHSRRHRPGTLGALRWPGWGVRGPGSSLGPGPRAAVVERCRGEIRAPPENPPSNPPAGSNLTALARGVPRPVGARGSRGERRLTLFSAGSVRLPPLRGVSRVSAPAPWKRQVGDLRPTRKKEKEKKKKTRKKRGEIKESGIKRSSSRGERRAGVRSKKQKQARRNFPAPREG